MFNVVDVINFVAEKKCEVVLDSFSYNKISSSMEQVGNVSATDKMRVAEELASAKNAVEVSEVLDRANKIAFEKAHLKFSRSGKEFAINALSYNETRANISIAFRIDGTVALPSDAPSYLPKDFGTFIFRNYNVIHDGVLNIASMTVKMDKADALVLVSNGVNIVNTVGDYYTIDLRSIPLYNGCIKDFSASKTSQLIYEVMAFKAALKVYKYFLEKNTDDNRSANIESKYGKDAVVYLNELGITDNGFNPKTQEKPSSSTYKARELIVKFSGMSSIPSINAYIKKVDGGKKLNNADLLIKEVYDTCSEVEKSTSHDDFIKFIKEQIDFCNKKIKENNKLLSEIKMYIFTSSSTWFADLSASNTTEYKGIPVEFVKREVDVEI